MDKFWFVWKIEPALRLLVILSGAKFCERNEVQRVKSLLAEGSTKEFYVTFSVKEIFNI